MNLKRSSKFLLSLFLMVSILIYPLESLALTISPVPELSPSKTVKEIYPTLQRNPEFARRFQKFQAVRLGDVLGIPKMHQTLSSNPYNRAHVEHYLATVKSIEDLPLSSNSKKILINVVKGKPQLLDGHHRIVAALVHNPDLTIGDISPHIRDILINGVDSNGRKLNDVDVHILASMNRPALEKLTKDGRVKRINSDVAYDDLSIFSKNSAGRPLGDTAREFRRFKPPQNIHIPASSSKPTRWAKKLLEKAA